MPLGRHPIPRPTVHELKQLVDHGAKKLPVVVKKTWILAHHIHNIARNDRLVIFALLDFAEPQ